MRLTALIQTYTHTRIQLRLNNAAWGWHGHRFKRDTHCPELTEWYSVKQVLHKINWHSPRQTLHRTDRLIQHETDTAQNIPTETHTDWLITRIHTGLILTYWLHRHHIQVIHSPRLLLTADTIQLLMITCRQAGHSGATHSETYRVTPIQKYKVMLRWNTIPSHYY